ncbi:MAG: ATP-binding cassette domain-containing protein [Clostridiales bacterium]|nr:ATP-binding cassette domain-containing protein [Clostridiales bacterium]
MRELLRIVHGCLEDVGGDELRDYNVEIYEGDILYIQGVEDSGIRTLAKVFAGDCALKDGSLFLNGKKVEDYDRNTAFYYRIYTITAERDLVGSMSVAENLEAVRHLPFPPHLYDRKKAEHRVNEYLKKEQVDIRAEEELWLLSQTERKKLSILKANMHGARLIILDATHGFYEGKEAEEICELIRRANTEGITFVILSRCYTPFAEIANRIQILAGGIDLKEWGRIDERIRGCLRRPAGGTAAADMAGRERSFLGIYDYEWEMEDGIWYYLSFMRRQNPLFWDREVQAHIPEPGCSFCIDTAVIPINSGENLVSNLDIADNLLLPIPLRAGRGPVRVIRPDIRRNIVEKFYRTIGIEPDKTHVSDLDRIQRKILSIYRWELARPGIMILESPYSGLTLEEVRTLRTYLQEMVKRGIRILYFSKTPEDMREDCEKVILTQNGKNAKIATFSHFFPPLGSGKI